MFFGKVQDFRKVTDFGKVKKNPKTKKNKKTKVFTIYGLDLLETERMGGHRCEKFCLFWFVWFFGFF